MITWKARTAHNPSTGSFGDCFRTVIASILDEMPELVPHFFDDGNVELGYWRLGVWLADRGLMYVETRYPGEVQTIDEFAKITAAMYPDTYLIVGGATPRLVNHVVIMLNGKVVSDPNQDDAGLAGPTDAGYYSIGFLVSAKHKP